MLSKSENRLVTQVGPGIPTVCAPMPMRSKDRSIEPLAESDHGIVMLRCKRRDHIDAVAAGRDPACITRNPADDKMIKFETTLQETEYVLEKV